MSTIITLADEFELWTLKSTAATFLPKKKNSPWSLDYCNFSLINLILHFWFFIQLFARRCTYHVIMTSGRFGAQKSGRFLDLNKI